MAFKMKFLRTYLSAAVLAIATAISGWSSTASAALTNDFDQLNASQIVAQMGAGWNLGNQLEASNNGTPSETAWGNPVITQALIQKVKAAGFKTIRIPVSYLNLIGSAPNYTINSTWMNRIKTVVDYAYNEGLTVIINIHGDGYNSVVGSWLLVNSGDQTTIKAKYQKVWQQIANTFVNYDERLIFESMNEEFDGTYGTPNTAYYANLNAYNQIFVDTVRQTGGNNSARWLLIPGWNTNIDYTVGNYGFVMPTDQYRSTAIPSTEKRIMLSVHYYSPWDFAGEESGNITQWGATAANASKKSTWGQEDYLESQMKSVYDKFVSQGYPAVIGEFGSIDKTAYDSTNNTYRAAFAKAIAATAKKYSSVPVYWDNGYNGQHGFGLFNRSTYAVTQQGIIDAIMSGIGNTTANNSTITPSIASFDKKTANQADIAVTMTLNGNTLSGIKNGSATLVSGTDYAISGNTVTIKKSYLAAQAVGTTNLTFDFSAGSDPILAISIVDTSVTVALPGAFTASGTSGNASATLTWTASSGAASYKVERATGSGAYTTIASNLTSLTYTDTTAVNGTLYNYRVVASNTAGSTNSNVVTLTPAGTTTTGSFKIQMYSGNTTASSNTIAPRVKIVNTGTTSLNLSTVKLRYYYTIDANITQAFWYDWASVGSSNVTGSFVTMATPKSGADTYFEIGFASAAGSLAPGAAAEIQIRISRTDWSNYTQSGDYSFSPTGTSYVDWTKMTGYVNGALQWGIEP
ncbi:cellulase family glycosylhydrolase [Paenibacillus terricola]|nr:cellulase family glycosylhydrolase [Paenibacillus terricola]